MSLTVVDITIIIRWLHLIIGNILALIGIIGSIGTLLVFSHPKLSQSVCSRYIIAGSMFDLIQIIDLSLPNLFLHAFQIDTFSKHAILCKLRAYIGISTSPGSHFCLYMSLFDRWTKSSRDVHRRGLSTKQLAKEMLIILVIFCIMFGIPKLFIFDVITISFTGEQICFITSSDYIKYFTYFVNPVLTFCLPLIIISTFGILTWINITKLGGQRIANRLEKQLTRITIFQALTVIISSIPNNVQFFYSAITSSYTKDSLRIAQENLFAQITYISFCIVYVCPFYIYLCFSSEVRRLLKQIICQRRHRVGILINNI